MPYFRNALIVTSICLASHWMLLLNDGFFWDDNLFYTLLDGSNYDELRRWMYEMGLPLNYYFFHGYHLIFEVSDHRLVSFVVIWASAFVVQSIFRYYSGRFESLSLVFVAFYLTLLPFRSTVLLSTLNYQVMLLLFLIAVLVRVKYASNGSLAVRLIALLVFLTLSFASFNTASILVLYCFYCAFEYFHLKQFRRCAFGAKAVGRYVLQNFHILVLPFAYWAFKNAIFPTHGLYEGYNKLGFDPGQIFKSGLYYFLGITKSGIIHNVATRTPGLIPLLSILFFLLLAFPRLMGWLPFRMPVISQQRTLWIGWALAFLLVSAFPYVIVATSPRFQGWESRHYLLLTLSFPVALFVGMMVYLDRLSVHMQQESVKNVARPLIACIVIVGAVASNNVYMNYQAMAVKQWAVVESLRVKPELQRFSNFRIDDQVGDFSKTGFFGIEATRQTWYEWAAVFAKAWGSQRWYGHNIDDAPERPPRSIRYGTSDIDPDVLTGKLVLKNTTSLSQTEVVVKYWLLKYFGTEEKLKDYLTGLIAIEVLPWESDLSR